MIDYLLKFLKREPMPNIITPIIVGAMIDAGFKRSVGGIPLPV